MVWKLIEISAPVPVGADVWIVRTFLHVVEGRLYLDIRKWEEKLVNERMGEIYGKKMVPSEVGSTLPIPDQFRLFEVAIQQALRHKDNK